MYTEADIYEYSRMFGQDYYDKNTNMMYHIEEYNEQIKNGIQPKGIRVSVNGETVGYVTQQ